MEDANLYTKQHQQQQKQLNQANLSKFYYHFLYKAIIVSIFLIILSLFPSQAPDFINHTLNTRGWEFLHLVFVGIAISYGLFSRRNDDEPEKLDNNKINNNNIYSNAQSYVSRLLQASSIFGEEAEIPTGSSSDEEKFQSWSNQYCKNDPVVVVAEESPVIVKEKIKASEKPLLLPVRRLKSHSLGEKVKDQVVAPSSSPWKSITGRIDIRKDDDDEDDDPELEYINRPSGRLPSISSPKKLDSSASFSSETRAKSAENFVRKKGMCRPLPPPPPPPPLPQLFRKAVSMKQSYMAADQVVYPEKNLRRSFSGEEAKGLNFPRSVRTIQSSDWLAGPRKDEELDEKVMEESEEDLEMDEEEEGNNSGSGYAPEVVSGSSNQEDAGPGSSGDGGPDVDKKADEFIARFREQIRLQRIECIKRSSGKVNRNSSR